MAAGMVATFIIFNQTVTWLSFRPVFVLVLTFGLSSLMVSTIRFPSYKEFNWRSKATFGYFLVGVLIMILIVAKPEITLFLLLSTYIGLSLGWNLVRMLTLSVPSKTEKGSATVL